MSLEVRPNTWRIDKFKYPDVICELRNIEDGCGYVVYKKNRIAFWLNVVFVITTLGIYWWMTRDTEPGSLYSSWDYKKTFERYEDAVEYILQQEEIDSHTKECRTVRYF